MDITSETENSGPDLSRRIIDMRQVLVPRQVGLKILVEGSLLPIAALAPPIFAFSGIFGQQMTR